MPLPFLRETLPLCQAPSTETRAEGTDTICRAKRCATLTLGWWKVGIRLHLACTLPNALSSSSPVHLGWSAVRGSSTCSGHYSRCACTQPCRGRWRTGSTCCPLEVTESKANRVTVSEPGTEQQTPMVFGSKDQQPGLLILLQVCAPGVSILGISGWVTDLIQNKSDSCLRDLGG
jgi:hypothetical protein